MRKSTILKLAGLLCALVAFVVAAFNVSSELVGERAALAAMDGIQLQIDAASRENAIVAEAAEKELRAKKGDAMELEDFMVPEYVINPDMDMPSVTENDHEYIGIISIPSVDIKLPVMSEWSYANLKLSPCRYSGSVYKNDMVIAAHNYRSHFGRLKNVKYGDLLTFTDVSGNVFSYEVSEIETLQPSQSFELEHGDWDLSLFTCTLGGSARIAVRCTTIEQE